MSRPCNRFGCLSEAAWQVGLRVWADRVRYPGGFPAEGPMGLWVCDEHHEVSPNDVLTDKSAAQLHEAFYAKGLALPDLSTLEVFLIPPENWTYGP